MPDCCPAVPGSNPASPQPTADCQSPGGLPPGMALGCRLTSVRGNRGENYEKEPLVRKKHIKKKKVIFRMPLIQVFIYNITTELKPNFNIKLVCASLWVGFAMSS